jgi:hypothetical protein
MAFGSSKSRRHRAKGWRRRKRGFGVLLHRGASSTRTGAGTRELTVKVGVERNIGASRPNQFCAWAWIPKWGRGRRAAGLRSGRRTCGPTPTIAVKRSLRMLTKESWT